MPHETSFTSPTSDNNEIARKQSINQYPCDRQSEMVPFLVKVISLHSYDAPGDPMLPVELNDVICIEQRQDDRWFLARFDSQTGRLPVECCQVLDDTISEASCRYLIENNFYDLHICFASFVAQDVGDLSITKGDIVVACNRVNEHWMQGQVCYDGQANLWPKLAVSQQIGTFPLNHCWSLDSEKVKAFCQNQLNKLERKVPEVPPPVATVQNRAIPAPPVWSTFVPSTVHSSSLSSGSSSQHSSDNQPIRTNPPPRPTQLPRQISKDSVDFSKKPAILSGKQHDRLKGWLTIVRKKTARISTRITASLGLISLTRDEEFERHYECFKHIEKTIKAFIKNILTFVEHFESFLLSLQHTSENLSDFYRDKSHQKEIEELRRKNKVLTCEHFHEFKRTVDRQVVAVASQLLQKFSGPHHMISKRSAKLLDYDNKTKELESCSDIKKKSALHEEYVIAKELYDRINQQLIRELPIFNQFSIEIFKECILVLLDGRRNLILAYINQTSNLLNTPLMSTYTASDVASHILMSCETADNNQDVQINTTKQIADEPRDSGRTSGHDSKPNSADEFLPRSQSVSSQLSSEFEQMAIINREISSTPLSQVGDVILDEEPVRFDEPDARVLNSTINERASSEIDKKDDHEAQLSSDTRPFSCEQPSKERRKRKKSQIYIASWPFVATGPNQLTVTCDQPLKLIKGCDECGNSDWSLVRDKRGQLGYVPSSYIVRKL